ncbi:MAG: hypothetical protein A2122_00255 [Candidatus Liptonbacteria bacterium GWB1_49_6]|uniref:Uncharacterized protein n=1 Tax=Candidatus Liptonbacteria bacterium GWB1_49_6 TaxID=1798644 RepID=A0A1G2C816_9BACT|nr:MAG: hypothetical protein A2122_00255 [Candidatus Liptonbacteria bacterium GWB1_49_6]
MYEELLEELFGKDGFGAYTHMHDEDARVCIFVDAPDAPDSVDPNVITLDHVKRVVILGYGDTTVMEVSHIGQLKTKY